MHFCLTTSIDTNVNNFKIQKAKKNTVTEEIVKSTTIV